MLGSERDAAEAAVFERLHQSAERVAHRLAAANDDTRRQKDLHIVRILRHQPIPVAAIQRVEMLVDDRFRCRLRFELGHLRHSISRSENTKGAGILIQRPRVASLFAFTLLRLSLTASV